MQYRIGFLLFALLGVFGFGRIQAATQSDAPQASSRTDLQITSALTLSSTTPGAGQAVTAQFSIRNNSSNTIEFAQIGAGGRGPDCAEWSCNNYSDFPLAQSISISPGGTYVYSAQRLFIKEGTYFTQIVYQLANGIWFFSGERIDFTVSNALKVSTPLQFQSPTSEQDRLLFATFKLRNDGSQPIHFQAVGIGVRGPNCAQFNWSCRAIHDYQFEQDMTIEAGQVFEFSAWRAFGDLGTHFAQVTIQDSTGIWRRLGEPTNFEVLATQPSLRITPYKLGVHYHPVWNVQDGERLRLAKSAGADLVRVAVSWRLMEPHVKGQWETAWYLPALANVIDEANRLGMQVLIMVQDVPCWASSDPNRNCNQASWDARYPPRNNQDYADALRKLVQLHAPKIVAWEIWNEPNDPRFWRPAPNAADYTQLLRTAYTAIKSENSREIVLGGSLAGADMPYLLEMYSNGAKGYFDGLALHPYSGTAAPNACPNLRSSYGCGIQSMRDMMLHLQDDKPIWLTEFGWSAYAGSGGVGDAQHLDHLQRSLAMLEQWDYVPVATWYNLIDTTSAFGHLEFEDHMGWYRSDLSAKNSAEWLQSQVIDTSTLTEKLFLPSLFK